MMYYIFYATSPMILVVYMVYFIVLCYIPHGIGSIYGVLHRSKLHPSGYWWCIRCTTSFNDKSSRILVVYMVQYIFSCYIPQSTGGVYDVLDRSMLHPPGYWWCILCTTSFYVTSPRILVIYMVNYIFLCYIPEGTGGVYDVLHRFMLHPP